MKKFFLLSILFVINFSLFAKNPVYKEFIINGETLGKWVYVTEYWYEYDSKGNQIHYKDSDGNEEWYEYDFKGNQIHYKNSYGNEYWCEFDSKGNQIHFKKSDGSEEWYEYEYDSNNRIIK